MSPPWSQISVRLQVERITHPKSGYSFLICSSASAREALVKEKISRIATPAS